LILYLFTVNLTIDHGAKVISIHPSDVLQAYPFWTRVLALTVICAGAKALLVHLLNHLFSS
jgi:hypothetical protein